MFYQRMVVLILMILIISSTTGCLTSKRFVQQRYPYIEYLPMSSLTNVPKEEIECLDPTTKRTIADNYNVLIIHKSRLETSIEAYNKYAKEQNKKSGLYDNLENE